MLKDRLVESKFVQALVNFGQSIKLPGFEGLSLYTLIVFLWRGMQKGKVNTRASAISFRIILALAPTFILLVSLIPYIPIDNFQEDIINNIASILPPSTFDLVDEMLVDLIQRKHSTFVSISFLIGLFYASNSVNALLEGLGGAFHLVKKQNPIKQRLISVGLIIVLPVFMGIAFLLQTSSSVVMDWLISKNILGEGLESLVVLIAKWLLVVLLINSAISVLYNVANPTRKKWRFISAGSTFSSLLIILVSQGFAFYVNNFAQFNKFYGSLGTVVILLIWIQLNVFLLLLGFELNTSLSKAKRELKNADEVVANN